MCKKKLINKWKALDNIDFEVIPDTTFTRDKTGAGSIEYFQKEHPEGITYPNGYHKEHPSPGNDVILYNPNTNDEQDIRLDALHIMPKNATYDALNTIYREKAKNSDVVWNAKRRYEEDAKKYGKENIDPFIQYFNNESDGLLRNMFIEGTPEYIKSKRYYPDKKQLREWNKHILPEIDSIQQYLETGERPQHILPEVVVTSKRKIPKNQQGNVLEKVFGIDLSRFKINSDSNLLDNKDISNPNRVRDGLTMSAHAPWVNPLFVNNRPAPGFITFPRISRTTNPDYKNSPNLA